MLLQRHVLDGIVAGTITLAFRRWRRPTVRAGGRLRTAAGELAIDAADVVTLDDVTAADARRAGFPSREALLATSTESLGVGYRLSPRGRAVLTRLPTIASGTTTRR
jgi:hypothetical protein